ncbi:hypothetical protein V9T40_000466 [Parthenolecanium corni]|uniref:Uncharacterized protein n=1 Tax=Parthenolecanium corni TaxID=536013 RepID=A0AAN9Y0G9_9HEMI
MCSIRACNATRPAPESTDRPPDALKMRHLHAVAPRLSANALQFSTKPLA